MDYTVSGEIAQYASVTMNTGDEMWASNGSIVSHSKGIDWSLRVPGGVSGAIRRSFSGEGLSLTHIDSDEMQSIVRLGANAPGHVVEWVLESNAVFTTRGSFLAAWGTDINIDVSIARRASAAFFGGAGLFLQRIAGSGKVLVHGSGDFADLELNDRESILVSTGNLAAFADTIDYQIETVKGVRNALFGREGLFMTRLTGPGRVLLQSLKR